MLTRLKGFLVGRPKETAGLQHERLSKPVGLAVFAADNLSSAAYATEEMLVVLVLGGTAALFWSIPITLTIAALVALIAYSYRATIHAYPQAAGAYNVTSDNLGRYPSLLAGSALLIDYVLTVAVSISASVAAVVSAAPGLAQHTVTMALALILLITLLNLRGVKESGIIFAVPTFAFIILVLTMIGWGLFRFLILGAPPPEAEIIQATTPVGLVLLARAFAHGSTAVTGIEAISDGVGAFRKPEAHNAVVTLGFMAGILAFLFVGITVLAFVLNIAGPSEDPKRTVISLIALTVFGSGPMFVAIQTVTALILFLAANTSYADFPRLSSFLAKDRFLPRQLLHRGDRLALSNGIIALAIAASILVWIFEADVSRLINLYVIGVFTSLTLSQIAMVRHWKLSSDPTASRKRIVNIIGAVATTIVLTVVLLTKFLDGAWIVVAAIPLLILLLERIHRHYQSVGLHLRSPALAREDPTRHEVIVLIQKLGESEKAAVSYSKYFTNAPVRFVHFDSGRDDVTRRWSEELQGAMGLESIPKTGSLASCVSRYVTELQSRLESRVQLTVVVPEEATGGLLSYLAQRRTLLVKARLLFRHDVAVTNVRSTTNFISQSKSHVTVVLASAVHNGTMRAIHYADRLDASLRKILHVEIDPDETRKVVFSWEVRGTGQALEVVESPYRELTTPVKEYVRALTADKTRLVTLILPEFVVAKRRHQLLHNQTALALKAAFLEDESVVVTSVPTRVT